MIDVIVENPEYKQTTLDQALDEFNGSPSDKACGVLIEIALQYYQDDMIGVEEYSTIMRRISEWLIDE